MMQPTTSRPHHQTRRHSCVYGDVKEIFLHEIFRNEICS